MWAGQTNMSPRGLIHQYDEYVQESRGYQGSTKGTQPLERPENHHHGIHHHKSDYSPTTRVGYNYKNSKAYLRNWNLDSGRTSKDVLFRKSRMHIYKGFIRSFYFTLVDDTGSIKISVFWIEADALFPEIVENERFWIRRAIVTTNKNMCPIYRNKYELLLTNKSIIYPIKAAIHISRLYASGKCRSYK